MAADLKGKYGSAAAAITITLNSLANAGARESTAVDNTTNLYLTAKVLVSTKTNASAPTGSKCCNVYAYGSDGTSYPDAVTGSDADITLQSPTNLVYIGSVSCPSASTIYKKVFDTAAAFPGGLPAKWGIVVVNATGNALDAASCAATYQGFFAQSV
jgi:hypothetical protein